MSIPSIPPILPMPIANGGDTREIPDQTPMGTNQLSFQSGFPSITSSPLAAGGVPPQREDFNAAYKLLSQHIFFQQSGGVYPWVGPSDDGAFPGLNYLTNNLVMDRNTGIIYQAVQPSGPDYGGAQPTSNLAYWLSTTPDRYEVGQYYSFQDEMPRPGMLPLTGVWVENFSRYSRAVEYFQTTYGQKRLVTLDEYNARHTAFWHTNADGSKTGWDGVGGVNVFVWDKDADALLGPDLSEMFECNSGPSLDVGGTDGDRGRRLTASTHVGQQNDFAIPFYHSSGAFTVSSAVGVWGGPGSTVPGQTAPFSLNLDNARVVPTGPAFAPRRYGAMACVYLGPPTS